MNENVKKTTITDDVVRYVARLSRLSLENGEVDRFRGQLSQILDYIAQLEEVDTEGVLPTTHALSSVKNVFREDEERLSIPPEEATGNAPSKKDNLFRVPRVINEE